MRPPLSVAGTRWTRWTPLSNFSFANTPLPVDAGDDFLVAAGFGRAGGDQLDPPALRLGIALVHAEQIAREQRRLVAAGAGADFEHRRALVGRIARQQRQRQRALGLAAACRAIAAISSRAIARDLGIGVRSISASTPSSARNRRTSPAAARDRLQLGIFLRHRDEAIDGKSPVAISACNSSRRASICGDAFGGDGGHACADAVSQASTPPAPTCDHLSDSTDPLDQSVSTS